MDRKEYSAGAVKHSFWFMEFRKVVSLRSEGKTWDDIKQLNDDENLFGASTSLRSNQIWSTVTGRIKCLDDSFYTIFESCDLASQKLFSKEDVPAATQLFTPEWIVKYMVENSLGRIWLEGHHDTELRGKWIYYLDESQQDSATEHKLQDGYLSKHMKSLESSLLETKQLLHWSS